MYVPFLPVATATVATSPGAPAKEEPSFWAQTSSRWDVFKWIAGAVFVFAGVAVADHYSIADAKGQIADTKSQIAVFQAAKETRGERLSVVEHTVAEQEEQHTKDVAEIKKAIIDQNIQEREDMKAIRSSLDTLMLRSAK